MLRLPSFTYLQPKTLTEALAMKTEAGPAGSYVAGGTDLYPNKDSGAPEVGQSDGRTVGR